VPSWSGLISPSIDVPRNGPLVLRFAHRYSFEYTSATRWDGGQVRLSANGGDFQPVGASSFCAHGYDGIIQGGGPLQTQEGFNGNSAGYAGGALITSTANLGQFKAGDTLRLQFLGSWDLYVQASLPNWLIDRVSVTEGECALPATFSVVADGALPGVLDQAVHYQWQRDCGLGFTNMVDAANPSYSFVPTPADVACQFRCVVSVPGLSATSSVARVTITPPQMAIRREGPNVLMTWTGVGTLQNAQNLTGPWVAVGGVSSNSISLRPTAAQRFYRLRVP
jgi:hypothetical protein